MREDGAARRDGGRHRLDTDIDAGAVERGKPARVHEHTLPIDDIRVKQPRRGFQKAPTAVSIRSPRCPHISLAGSFSCQPSLSIITLGVFLRKHCIAEVRNDALTESFIGPSWDDFVQPKKGVVLDARQ